MANSGRIGFEEVAWFNGGLFDDSAALPLERSDIDVVLKAAALDWSEIDPSILGTLFERGLDPAKRAQLGAHYTDRDKIMQLIDPAVVEPLLAEWKVEKTAIKDDLDRSEAAKSRSAKSRLRSKARQRMAAFLTRLRAFTVLDPACGSGHFCRKMMSYPVSCCYRKRACGKRVGAVPSRRWRALRGDWRRGCPPTWRIASVHSGSVPASRSCCGPTGRRTWMFCAISIAPRFGG